MHTTSFLQFSKEHNSKTIELCGKHCFDLIYISVKYHEDILNIVYRRMDERSNEKILV